MECGEQEDEEIIVDEEESEVDEEEEETDEENGKCVNQDDTHWDQVHCKCKHAVENSSRFSLRVMEAMRFLQSYENVLPISSVNDIVDYITKNYNNDGDLYAQVRTALKQLCAHGFVVEVLKDEYQLIGPLGSSAMSETCNCEVDCSHSEIYSSTPKRTKLRRKFNKKFQKKPRCHCEKLQDEPKLDKSIHLSHINNLNNTMFATPKNRVLRSTLKDNNVKMHSLTENTLTHERSNHNIPKRIRKTNNDVATTSRSTEQYENANFAQTNRRNENRSDSIFREIKNFTPTRSKTREKELRKWIQRCRRECEQQRKNNK